MSLKFCVPQAGDIALTWTTITLLIVSTPLDGCSFRVYASRKLSRVIRSPILFESDVPWDTSVSCVIYDDIY